VSSVLSSAGDAVLVVVVVDICCRRNVRPPVCALPATRPTTHVVVSARFDTFLWSVDGDNLDT